MIEKRTHCPVCGEPWEVLLFEFRVFGFKDGGQVFLEGNICKNCGFVINREKDVSKFSI
jgi:C4-type Zn-finger protein